MDDLRPASSSPTSRYSSPSSNNEWVFIVLLFLVVVAIAFTAVLFLCEFLFVGCYPCRSREKTHRNHPLSTPDEKLLHTAEIARKKARAMLSELNSPPLARARDSITAKTGPVSWTELKHGPYNQQRLATRLDSRNRSSSASAVSTIEKDEFSRILASFGDLSRYPSLQHSSPFTSSTANVAAHSTPKKPKKPLEKPDSPLVAADDSGVVLECPAADNNSVRVALEDGTPKLKRGGGVETEIGAAVRPRTETIRPEVRYSECVDGDPRFHYDKNVNEVVNVSSDILPSLSEAIAFFDNFQCDDSPTISIKTTDDVDARDVSELFKTETNFNVVRAASATEHGNGVVYGLETPKRVDDNMIEGRNEQARNSIVTETQDDVIYINGVEEMDVGRDENTTPLPSIAGVLNKRKAQGAQEPNLFAPILAIAMHPLKQLALVPAANRCLFSVTVNFRELKLSVLVVERAPSSVALGVPAFLLGGQETVVDV